MADRHNTTPKEWAIAIGGGLVLATGLVMWLRPAASMVAANSSTITEAAPSLPAPFSPPQPPPQPMPQPQALPPPALTLRGILGHGIGGSAVLEDAKGTQRLVAIGRPVAAGWRLVRLSPNAATFESDNGELHVLPFESSPTTTETAAPTVPSKTLKATPRSLVASSTAYRLALRPVAGETEVKGWLVQSPATIPLFRLAGLQAGDTLLSVNGQPLFSEEKILELPSEIAGANALDVEFMRAGKKTTVRIDLNR